MRRRFLIDSDHHSGAVYSNIRGMIGQFAGRLADLNADETVDERICLFNGDMFDVEEGQLSRKKMIKRADKMMRAYLEAFPNVHFAYVMGNHEDFRQYHETMQAIARDYPARFTYSPDYLQFDDMLFTHGDLQIRSRGIVADKELPGGVVEREKARGYRELDEGESALSYAIKGQLKGLISLLVAAHIFPFKKSVQDVLQAFREHEEGFFKNHGIRHVFIGHIHPEVTKSNYRPEEDLDLAFHVSGAAVRSSPHVMYDVIQQDGATVNDSLQRYYMKPGREPKNLATADARIQALVEAYRNRFFSQEETQLAFAG